MPVPDKTVVTGRPATARPRNPARAPRVDRGAGGRRIDRDHGRGRDRRVGGGGSSPGTADNAVATGVTRITQWSLSSQMQVSATLGYAEPTTIVVPAGTAPSNLQQAEQTVATDRGDAAERPGRPRLRHRDAGPAAGRPGGRAGEGGGRLPGRATPPRAHAAGGLGRRRLGSTPCASDEQTVTTDEQSETQARAKVAADQSQVSSGGARACRCPERACGGRVVRDGYGQSSAYTALPAVGKIVRRGQGLYSVSGQPVVLFYGPGAAWRAFSNT